MKDKLTKDLFNWATANDPVTSKSGQSNFLAIEIDEKLGRPKQKKAVISAKTITRMYDTYIAKTDNLRISVNTWNLICRFLGYLSYADYVEQNNDPDKAMVVFDLKPADFDKEDQREEWPVYQVAFLWFDTEPPNVEQHFHSMTRDIEDKKYELHHAIEVGKLEASRTYKFTNGLTRYITRGALIAYANTINQKPKFLFKELR